ncbi:hypothetical protein [Kitasatospora sp. NPDC094015]|uniref:hypothetical protein n=1 Tax=Kitasatospora sp. NPDC094015 TaxID=3155205 RepID=UPI0033182F79
MTERDAERLDPALVLRAVAALELARLTTRTPADLAELDQWLAHLRPVAQGRPGRADAALPAGVRSFLLGLQRSSVHPSPRRAGDLAPDRATGAELALVQDSALAVAAHRAAPARRAFLGAELRLRRAAAAGDGEAAQVLARLLRAVGRHADADAVEAAARAGSACGAAGFRLAIADVTALTGLLDPRPAAPAPASTAGGWRYDDAHRRLLERAVRGEPASFDRLYDRFAGSVADYLLECLRHDGTARELAEETRRRARERIGRYPWGPLDVGAWLRAIARDQLVELAAARAAGGVGAAAVTASRSR